MKTSLHKCLNKIAERANKKAFKQINIKRKKIGLPPLKFNPSRNYWI
jgi:uncharacterized protein YkwD